jgi:radical SAM-linked protein
VRGDAGFPVRLRYSKRGKVRFVGHRDLARAFERALRVAQLPLAFSRGFSPRPKVSLGLALGVGYESDAEYLDLELVERIDLDALPADLAGALPDGVTVDGAVQLVPRAPALQEAISSVEYRLTPASVRGSRLRAAVERAIDAPELIVETTRKGRRVVEDLRPGILHLAALDDDSVTVEVTTKPRGIRPAELLGVLADVVGVSPRGGEDRVLRTRQWIERDGARHEPLAADRASHAPYEGRDTSKGLIDVGRHDDGHDQPRAFGLDAAGIGATRQIA